MYVLMITPNKFPNGDAGAVRDESFAHIYQELGYKVIHIGMGIASAAGFYREIEYRSLYKKNESIYAKAYNSISYKRRLKSLIKYYEEKYGRPSLIHIYDIPKSGIDLAIKLSDNYQIPIIHDSVEWYSPCEFKHGKISYAYYLKNRTNTKLIRKPISVIAISSYLQDYFSSRNLRTIRVPVIMDSTAYNPGYHRGEKIRIVYAGSPAQKDYLRECIQGFNRLSEKTREIFDFHILGASNEFVKDCCNGTTPCEIKAFGRVSRDIVIQELEKSDFAILLRPENERYAKAGFPTKSVEAMMNGCAMLCNYSSDLQMYLKDMFNAIIIEDCSASAVTDAFERISGLDLKEILKIRLQARLTAEKYFDYRHYIDTVKELIDDN